MTTDVPATLRILSLEHVPFEDAANIGPWAEQRGHQLRPVHLYDGDALPPVDDVDALVVMGGPMNIYQHAEYPWLVAEKEFIRGCLDAGKAMLGVCLGAQLIADQLGGPVSANGGREIGWFDVTLTPQGQSHPLLAGLPATFSAFHWHGDRLAIPPGAAHLASSAGCDNQAFAFGDNVLGLQFHLDYSAESIRKMIRNCGEELDGSAHVQSAGEILDADAKVAALRAKLEAVLDNLFSGQTA